MKRLAAPALCACACAAALIALPEFAAAIGVAHATVAPAQVPPDTAPVDTSLTPTDATVTAETTETIDTTPVVVGESGAATPVPVAGPSAPLVQIPNGCPSPPVASVVFVGTMIAKVTDTARFHVEQVRAGSADGYMVGDLIDIRYDNETEYLSVDQRYLVGAVAAGTELALTSKVRESNALFGGNAVIGLTEKNLECPTIEDPVRTLNLDGSEVHNSLLQGFTRDKSKLVLAFVTPLTIAFLIIIGLVLIRWLFTLIFVTVQHAATGEPGRQYPRDRRHHPRRTSHRTPGA